MIDIILLTCNRLVLTSQTIDGLFERLKTPFKLIIVDNNSKDGTVNYLKIKDELNNNIELVLLNEDVNICQAYNKGFEKVQSDLFITMQDDIIIPALEPDVIQQLINLFNNNPDHGGIGCRIQRIPNVKWTDDDLSPARKALSAYFRIQKKQDIIAMGGFGDRYWDDQEFVKRMREGLGKKVSWANNLWCNHLGYGIDNRGYGDYEREWSSARKGQAVNKPYPQIDNKTNRPL